jgi:hypothetical protein
MSLIANAPLWFHIGVAMGGLLLAGLSITATRRLNRPDIGLQLSYLAIGISMTMLGIIASQLIQH